MAFKKGLNKGTVRRLVWVTVKYDLKALRSMYVSSKGLERGVEEREEGASPESCYALQMYVCMYACVRVYIWVVLPDHSI